MTITLLLTFLSAFSASAETTQNPNSLIDRDENEPLQERRFFYDDYEKCQWLVQYRGQTYDLSPLTKKNLTEPSSGDLRHVLQRAPKSEFFLKKMERDTRLSHVFTAVATASLVGFGVTRLAKPDKQLRDALSVTALLTLSFSTFKAWYHTKKSKHHLAESISAFNSISSEKIIPVEESSNATSY